MQTPEFPSWLPISLIYGLALGAIVLIAIWIYVTSFAKSKDGNIKKQLSVGVAGFIPIGFLFLIVGGALFVVGAWFSSNIVTAPVTTSIP